MHAYTFTYIYIIILYYIYICVCTVGGRNCAPLWMFETPFKKSDKPPIIITGAGFLPSTVCHILHTEMRPCLWSWPFCECHTSICAQCRAFFCRLATIFRTWDNFHHTPPTTPALWPSFIAILISILRRTAMIIADKRKPTVCSDRHARSYKYIAPSWVSQEIPVIEAPPRQNQSHLDSKARDQKIYTQTSKRDRGKGSKNYEHEAWSS